MTEPESTVISVRGDAQLEVQPDLGTLFCRVATIEADKATALAAAAHALDAVRDGLESLGAVVRAAAGQRAPLTWLARSATTHDDWEYEETKRRTGRTVAVVELVIEVRDFDLLDRLSTMLASQSTVQVTQLRWAVDADNTAWREVRAAAIEAALQQGRDYAAALGGSLRSIDQVADSGLLAHGAAGASSEQAFAVSRRAHGVGPDTTPSLDPEPITLAAVIEARFTASVATL